GSDVANSYGLGTLSSTLSTSGVIGTMTDVDYFGFTAGSSGTVSMAVTGITHELLPNCTVVGAEGTLENNVLTFDVVAGETYQVSLGTTAGIGYYDIGLTLDAVEAIVTPVDPVTIKTMVRNDGLIFSLDSENWLSVNGNRIWSNTYDFAVTDDLSIYWHSTNGYLQRLSSQGTWTTLDLDVTKFDVDASGVVYSLDADNVLSINGAAVWSYTADFEIADDQTIFWHCTNGYLMHRLANGSWEVFDDDANRFAVRSNGTVYSLGNDGWLNINGAIAWSGTQDFAFNEDQTLYWFSSTGMLQQLPNGGPWETLDTGVTQFAVGHDGANYSLSNNGEVSINGVATWSNIVDMRTDEMGYLVLEDVNGSLQRVAGRFELSSELALQSSVTSNSVSETDSEAANLAANSLDTAGQYFRGTTVSNHVVEKLGAVGSNSYQPADHFFSQAVRTDQDAFAWDHLLADNSSQQADFNFDRFELTEKDHGNEEQSLDAGTVDSLFEHLGVLV
ncbi:MAG: hypothetical protein KDA57_18420, partial [Planctomycetales bacterium]|nr:hypothetical protein [Planctomycetales bacterium]